MNTNRSTIACKELWINSASVGLRPDAEILLKPNDSYLLAHPNTELSQLTPSTAKAYLYTVIEVSDAKAFKSLGLVRGRVAHIKALSVDGTGLVGHFIITGIWLPENESDFPYAVSLHATTDSVHCCWEMVGTATDACPEPHTEEELTINIRKLAKEMETLESTIEVKDCSAKIELARNFDDLHLCVTSNRDPAEKVERFILPTEVSGRIRELESYTGVLKEGLHRYGKAYSKFVELKCERDALVAKRYVLRTKEDVSIAQQELREAERIFERALAQQRKAKEKANEKDSV